MKATFYLRYALRALRRGGQRTGLAILCVAFGVMSLVSLQILTDVISDALLVDPRLELGGDVLLNRQGRYLLDQDLAVLDELQQAGHIEAYTAFSRHYGQLLKKEDSGRVYFLARAMGIDPQVYPLEGELVLQAPGGTTLAAALQAPRGVAITRDLADELDLSIGDRLTLGQEAGSVPQRLHVTAIIAATPDHLGEMAFFSPETARLVYGRQDVMNYVSLRWGPAGEAIEHLTALGWSVRTPQHVRDDNQQIHDVFSIALKGAGILGLLVGGIGIANTLQVMLARRTLEIATLKTLGYRQRDLMALFGIETALLGLTGSVLGLGAAVALSSQLWRALERIVAVLMEWSIDPWTLLGGLLTGTVTAVIFGVYAILRASAVRPAVLLRNLPLPHTWRRHLSAFGVYALLALPFALLCTLIMGSVLVGVGVIGVALVGLVVLGLVLGAALLLMVWLPLPRLRLLSLARNNLRRQGMRTIFALIALFVGVFAVGFALATVLDAREQYQARSLTNDSYNLLVYSGPAHEAQVAEQVRQQPLKASHVNYQAPLQRVQVGAPGDPDAVTLKVKALLGRPADDPDWDLALSGEPWDTVPDGVYLPSDSIPEDQRDVVKPGSALTVVDVHGEAHTLTVAGFYSTTARAGFVEPADGLLVSRGLALALGGARTTVSHVLQVPGDRLLDVTETLGRALPEAMVMSWADLRDAMQRTLNNLLVFVVSVAGLALVAGAVLIANAVGLAIVERRREIGILKAVGFNSGDVLKTFLLEHGLLGLLGGAAGTVAVAMMIRVLNAVEPQAQLSFRLLPGLGITLVAVAIALLSAALVAWRPTRVRPLAVLRDE